MAHHDTPQLSESDGSNALTPRSFLQGSTVAAGGLGLSQGSPAAASQTSSAGPSSYPFKVASRLVRRRGGPLNRTSKKDVLRGPQERRKR